MKRIHPSQRGHMTTLGALMSLVPNLGFFDKIGMSDTSILNIALDAGPVTKRTDHWRSAPFGTSKGGVKQNARKAAKRRAVLRARARGHA
tara:strand:- start:232 stop:501 length:270 start_codon:yes stop_codon:yes gene_type:complete